MSLPLHLTGAVICDDGAIRRVVETAPTTADLHSPIWTAFWDLREERKPAEKLLCKKLRLNYDAGDSWNAEPVLVQRGGVPVLHVRLPGHNLAVKI